MYCVQYSTSKYCTVVCTVYSTVLHSRASDLRAGQEARLSRDLHILPVDHHVDDLVAALQLHIGLPALRNIPAGTLLSSPLLEFSDLSTVLFCARPVFFLPSRLV